VDQARFEIHHRVGIGKVAREAHVGTLGDARTQAQITGFQRGGLGALRRKPELFALVDNEHRRVVITHQIPVLIEYTVICRQRH